jgi:hypothetical protein
MAILNIRKYLLKKMNHPSCWNDFDVFLVDTQSVASVVDKMLSHQWAPLCSSHQCPGQMSRLLKLST